MVTAYLKQEKSKQKQTDATGVKVDIAISNSNQMHIAKPIFTLLCTWFLSFLFILMLFLKVDHLRNYVLNDLISIKEIEKLERKTQNLIRYQKKHGAYEDDVIKIPSHELDDDINQLQIQLNKSLTALQIKPSSDVKFDLKVTRNNICSSKQNVVFIKTHKTASSTVTNILNRYADLRELTVVLPSMGDLRFSWPRKFHWSSVDLLRLNGQPANVLANHARYNKEQMDMVMEDHSKYITILRNPISQFESSFYYFEFDRILKLKYAPNPIEEFLKFPDEYLYNLTLLLGDLPDEMNLIQNGMFYDLGYDFIDLESDENISKVLKKLENEFSLVLIMEYFDESLVLLKKEFCWDTDDILYIKQNQRLKRIPLKDETKERIKDWNRADFMLYQHFNKTFWKKISKYGPEFWNEVKEFRQWNKESERICAPQKIIIKAFKINVDVSSFVMNPKVDRYNRYLCGKILMSEVEYLTYFRKKFAVNFGYQRILAAEGVKSLNRTHRLQSKLKSLMRRKGPKFYIPTGKKNLPI